MIHKPTIERFHRLFGGSIYTGKIQKNQKRQWYRWQVTGKHAEKAARLLLPYSYSKQPELECAIEFATLFDRKQGKRLSIEELQTLDSYYYKMRELKTYEWEIGA